MRKAGNVVHADVLKRRDGKSSGGGIVEYENVRDISMSNFFPEALFQY